MSVRQELMGRAGKLALWGGVECTVNRVGNIYHDQLERGGHAARIDDLDRIAALGIRVLRYPILWERTATQAPGRYDWSWSDERLRRLQALGIEPIVGLVHHGSGPRSTDLLDPGFPEALAEYAAAVAERYPWITQWTPVNEPLTTARFSALYGLWYPHTRDTGLWARALVHQCRGVALAMQRVRIVNSAARLVQTEDLGRTWSTPRLAYQAEFENERRWLTFDLLGGRVDRDHPLRGWLEGVGVPAADLDQLVEEPCPPDLLGINYYVTSERFLDEAIERYPASTHGGNGRDVYADIEAVRVLSRGLAGVGGVLTEAWERYRLPLAVTEAHLGCTREEQVRWLVEIWRSASALRWAGVDVRAVTVWSLFGAYDWHNLVTRSEGQYEPGAFDVRGTEPRPTALASTAHVLATGGRPDHPILDTPGWWRGPRRLLYPARHPAPAAPLPRAVVRPRCCGRPARPLLITGASGTLGRALVRICAQRGLAYHALSRAELDISDPRAVEAALAAYTPWAVVNAGGYVRVDDAEADEAACVRGNTIGPTNLAVACSARGVRLVTFSSDLVFDGARREPYREDDPVAPLNVYGRTKAQAESAVLTALPSALVVRTSAFFGPWDHANFVTAARHALASGAPFVAADDATVSPTYVPDLVHVCLDLLIDGAAGLWHLANSGAVTWADLARHAAERSGLDPQLVVGRPTDALGHAASRPRFSVLGTDRGELLPSLDNALDRYLIEVAPCPEVISRRPKRAWPRTRSERRDGTG